jgi:hypothetical protein
MAVTFIIATILQSLIEFMHMPVSLIGVALGATIPISNATGLIIGFMIGKFLERLIGKAWVDQYKSTIVAGILTGESLMLAISIGTAMILESIWIRPI